MALADSKFMTVAAYARHRGVTPEAVRYAIRVGKLQNAIVMSKAGVPKVDHEIGDQEWVLTPRAVGQEAVGVGDPTSTWPDDMKKVPLLAESRAKREFADAQLAELKLEKEKGKLIDADSVRREAFKVARFVRDALLNIPDRVAPELAGESNVFKVHARLTEEIRKTLESLRFEPVDSETNEQQTTNSGDTNATEGTSRQTT
jgi:hypothetical protein